jgi:hypothetical protein
MGAWQWLEQNWFSLAQTLGIIAGLLITAFTVRLDLRERRLANLMVLTGEHRDIWKALYERPELARLLSPAASPKQKALTRQEHTFVTLVVLHMGTVHRAMKQGLVSRLGGVRQDIGWFFSLPLPQAVWQNIKPLQDEEFVTFVEDCRASVPDG